MSSTPVVDRSTSAPGGRHDNDHSDFRKIAIFPTADEIACTESPFLRFAAALDEDEIVTNRVGVYLDHLYRILREDMLYELREEMQLMSGKQKGEQQNETDPVLNDLDAHDLIAAGFMTTGAAKTQKKPLRLATIDNYQADESDIDIASLTRSNSNNDLGFMFAPERIQTHSLAHTRAVLSGELSSSSFNLMCMMACPFAASNTHLVTSLSGARPSLHRNAQWWLRPVVRGDVEL
ncbi:hypothetical protein B0H13DRAFT_1158865 [Mycena leptocephala]|nr:hypothetical protein B0H13DRAFT_1158865 [Mycena leptocephala]